MLVNGDSIVEQLLWAWLCDLSKTIGSDNPLDVRTTPEDDAQRSKFNEWVGEQQGSNPVYISSDAMDVALIETFGGGGTGAEGVAGSVSVRQGLQLVHVAARP